MTHENLNDPPAPAATAALTLITPEELSEMLHVPVRTLEDWRSKGKGPRFIRVGRQPRYRVAAVEAWLDSLERGR